MPTAQARSRTRYWRHNLLLIAGLSCIWCLVTFVPAYFALELSRYFIFGWSINRPTETLLEYRVLFIWDGAEIY